MISRDGCLGFLIVFLLICIGITLFAPPSAPTQKKGPLLVSSPVMSSDLLAYRAQRTTPRTTSTPPATTTSPAPTLPVLSSQSTPLTEAPQPPPETSSSSSSNVVASSQSEQQEETSAPAAPEGDKPVEPYVEGKTPMWKELPVFARLADECKTDKALVHDYPRFYVTMLDRVRAAPRKQFNLLELGFGCNMVRPMVPGGGFILFSKYVPNLAYHSFEYKFEACRSTVEGPAFASVYNKILPKKRYEVLKKHRLFQGDQSNASALQGASNRFGPMDFIIDDASHAAWHQRFTFSHLFFSALKPGGTYVIEDVHMNFHTNADLSLSTSHELSSWIRAHEVMTLFAWDVAVGMSNHPGNVQYRTYGVWTHHPKIISWTRLVIFGWELVAFEKLSKVIPPLPDDPDLSLKTRFGSLDGRNCWDRRERKVVAPPRLSPDGGITDVTTRMSDTELGQQTRTDIEMEEFRALLGAVGDTRRFTNERDFSPIYARVFKPIKAAPEKTFELLEIGLGCAERSSGPLLFKLLKRFAPNVRYHAIDPDADLCLNRWKTMISPGEHAYLSDHVKRYRTVKRDIMAVVEDEETAGHSKSERQRYDIIVDSGDWHSKAVIAGQAQMFLKLFLVWLRPRGSYIMEDLQRHFKLSDDVTEAMLKKAHRKRLTTLHVLSDLAVAMTTYFGQHKYTIYGGWTNRELVTRWVSEIACGREICSVQKREQVKPNQNDVSHLSVRRRKAVTAFKILPSGSEDKDGCYDNFDAVFNETAAAPPKDV